MLKGIWEGFKTCFYVFILALLLGMTVMFLGFLQDTLACGKAPPEPRPTVLPSPTESPEQGEEEIEIMFACDKTCTDAERTKIHTAQLIIDFVKDKPCFQNVYLDPFISSTLTNTNGKTREEIVKDLATRKLNITVTFYYTSNRVVGWMNPGETTIHMNRYFHNSAKYNNPWLAASNMMHESAHVMGYYHGAAKSAGMSIPYRANRAIEACESVYGYLFAQ